MNINNISTPISDACNQNDIQIKAAPDKTIPDKTAPDKTISDKTVPNKTISDKAAPDKAVRSKARATYYSRTHNVHFRELRRELACRYFPRIKPTSAVTNLTRWIQGDPQLRADLEAVGYRAGTRYISRAAVRVMHRYFGKPLDDEAYM